MVPLTTRQGMTATELLSRVGGREVVLWGTGDLAQDVLTSLTKAGITVAAFLDTRASAVEKPLHGRPVRSAAEVLAQAGEVFVVLATPTFRQQAEAQCLKAGLRKGEDVISHLSVPRPQAIIDIANDCSLACTGCIRQTQGRHPAPALMDAATFAQVLDKLAAELPLLSHIDLALSGEPLLNPDLPRIIALAEGVAPCTVATGLAVDGPLEPLILAQPSRLDVTAFGFGESYDLAVPGGDWGTFTRRLAEMRMLIARHQPRTRFQVRLYTVRQDAPDLQERWRNLLQDSGIALAPQVPYVMPYDRILTRCEGEVPSPATRRAEEALPWNLERVLDACAQERHLPCLSQRIFPVINTDLSVGLCHLYNAPTVAPDYLATSWETLLALRHDAACCQRCQAYGLHRLDLDVLVRRHSGLFDPPSPSGEI